MKKVEDIKYSFRISPKRVTIGRSENYFLLVDFGLRADSSPTGNSHSHEFELPISKEKYEEIQRYLEPTKYVNQRDGHGKISISLNEEGKLELLIN